MLLYVAGPYRGDVRRNIARAGLIAARLWELGHTVICPHLNRAGFEMLTTVSNEQYVERDLEIVRRVDGLVMVPGWWQEESGDALAERGIAFRDRKPIWYWPEVPSRLGSLVRVAYSRHEVLTLEGLFKAFGPSDPQVRLFAALRREGLLDGLGTEQGPWSGCAWDIKLKPGLRSGCVGDIRVEPGP